MDIPGFTLDLSRLSQAKVPDPALVYDLLILGGGPAAMSAAVYAARKMMNLALLTVDFGGQVRETSEIENWLGFQSINAHELVSRFEEHVRSFDLPLLLETRVQEVKKEGERFRVWTEAGQSYQGHTVILATGKRHRPLNVPGEKELVGRGVAYCATCDAPLFKEKTVVVAGRGNSAFTTALDLLKFGARVTLVSSRAGWSADSALQTRVREFPALKFLENHQIVRVEGKEKVTAVVVEDREKKEKSLSADGLFVEIGLSPNSEPVRGLVELNERGEVIVNCECATSVPGLFAAGDVTTVPHKQMIISAGEGAKAALSAYDYLVRKGLL